MAMFKRRRLDLAKFSQRKGLGTSPGDWQLRTLWEVSGGASLYPGEQWDFRGTPLPPSPWAGSRQFPAERTGTRAGMSTSSPRGSGAIPLLRVLGDLLRILSAGSY